MPLQPASAAGQRSAWLLRVMALVAPTLGGLLAAAALMAVAGGQKAALASPAGATLSFPSVQCSGALQACIDGASAGQTIVVQQGRYTVSLTLSKAVSLTGVSSATVIVNALANQRVLTVTGPAVDSSVVISGLTLQGGTAAGGACACGGGIYITGTAQPRLVALRLVHNSAGDDGGGAYANNQLTMNNVAVLSNTSVGHGAGAYAQGSAAISGGVFQNNNCTAANTCRGGGAFAYDALAVTGTVWISNGATLGGGAVAAYGDILLSQAVFSNNVCNGNTCAGGALYTLGNLTTHQSQFLGNVASFKSGGAQVFGSADLSGDWFENNKCTSTFCVGGALAAAGLVATNTRFYSNTSLLTAGAVAAQGPAAISNTLFVNNRSQDAGALGLFTGDASLVNDLFAGNQASGHGDDVYQASAGVTSLLFDTLARPTLGGGSAVYVLAGTIGLTDTLIASQTVGIERAGPSSHAYEDHNLFSGVTTQISGTVIRGGHSLTGTADFTNPLAFDYHLRPGSAAIDKGIAVGILFDIDGDPRPIGHGFDIGFDEFLPRLPLYLPLVIR